jgi:hypothetical protein
VSSPKPAKSFDRRIFKPRETLGYLVGKLRRALLEAMEKEFAPHGLTGPQAIVMFQLANGDASRARVSSAACAAPMRRRCRTSCA